MPDSIWLIICAAFGVASYFIGYLVGHGLGYGTGHGDGWSDAVLYKAADRLRRDVYGEGSDD